MTSAQNQFATVLVVADRLRAVSSDRRVLQLLAELRTLLPLEPVHLLCSEGADVVPETVAGLGIEVVRVEPRRWLEEHRFSLSLVMLTGPASAHRLLKALRATQPQSAILGVLPSLAPLGRATETRFAVREEQLGAIAVEAHWRARQVDLLRQLDGIMVADANSDRRAASDAPDVPRLPYGVMVQPEVHSLEFFDRSGILSWGRFSSQSGEPDEEAAALVEYKLRPLVDALGNDLPVSARLELAPHGMSSLVTTSDARRHALRHARVLVVARTFGDPAAIDDVLAEAVEVGTPIISLAGATSDPSIAREAVDISDLARVAVQVGANEADWTAAREKQLRWTRSHSPMHSATELAKILSGFGVACEVRAAFLPSPGPLDRPPGPRTTQGQVQTLGLAQNRAISPSFARADISADHLWPHLAYESWWDAHPFPDALRSELRRRSSQLTHQPLISLVMPVYDTDPDVLVDAIESVLAQTYPFWELCAVDDASKRQDTVTALGELAGRDTRIRSERLEQNVGIVGASNAALELATGEFIGLLDHDDLLAPEALFEVVALLNEEEDLDFIYSDEDKLDLDDQRTTPFFKPSWSPHLHLGVNYVTHFAVYRRTLIESLGGFRPGFDGSQDYDLSLRASEIARRIGHIAKPIYTWRMVPGSAAVAHDAKPYALDAARRAISEALERRGRSARVERGLVPGTWRPRYKVPNPPLVSIIIPTRNGHRLLERCLTTVTQRTTYTNFEIIIVDNGSDDPDTLAYLQSQDVKVVHYPYRFNYARQMNLAVAESAGDQVLFLNNDMEVIRGDWLEAMVELAQHPEVGAVGARLLFPSGRPQHEGVFIGFGGGSAGNVDFGDYFGLGRMIRDATAVTAACMLMRLEPFHAIGGFDEQLRVAFNDVDLCLRLRQAGYQVVYTPYAELYHAESASRGKLHPEEDEAFFVRRWGRPGTFKDPFYNPNLDPVRPFRLLR